MGKDSLVATSTRHHATVYLIARICCAAGAHEPGYPARRASVFGNLIGEFHAAPEANECPA